MNPITRRNAIGSLKPDSASSVRASRRLMLEPRSTEKIAALSVRRDDRAEQQALERRETEEEVSGHGRDRCSGERADRRERDARPEHRPDLRPAGREPSLEQDQRDRDDADRARQLDVVELQHRQAVGAERHPEQQEEDEAGDPQSARRERRADAERQQESRDEDQPSVGQATSVSVAPAASLADWRVRGTGPAGTTPVAPRLTVMSIARAAESRHH